MKRAPQQNPFTNAQPLKVPFVEAYPDELQPVNQEKKRYFQPIRSQDLTVTPKIENLPKTGFEKIKADTPVTLSHVITEGKQNKKIDIRRTRKGTHKYNTRSRVNHVTTFKNAPQMFKKGYERHINNKYRLRLHCSHRHPKRYNHSGTSITPHYLWNHWKNPRIQRYSKNGYTSMDKFYVQQTWTSIPGLEITYGDWYNIIYLPQRKTKGKKGNICERCMRYPTPKNRYP